MGKIRVLIVDDSAFIRNAFIKFLSSIEEIDVVGFAKNGKEAYEKALELEPDVITMDIEMPIMTGLQALELIMNDCPCDVIMISTLTKEGADNTLKALNLGAIDFIAKKTAFNEVGGMKEELINKVLDIGRNSSLRNRLLRKSKISSNEKVNEKSKLVKNKSTNVDYPVLDKPLSLSERLLLRAQQKKESQNISSTSASHTTSNSESPKVKNIKVVSIGISTGGPISLQSVIPKIPSDFPVPILIVQHMPPHFTKSLADRLNGLSHVNVKEAENGDKIQAGWVYIAPGGQQMYLKNNGVIEISNINPPGELYNPSVNQMLNSLIDCYQSGVVSVIMTGMGHDGRDASIRLKKAGGYVISQDISSCVVAGMPKSVIDAGIVDEIHPLQDIAQSICSIFNLKAS